MSSHNHEPGVRYDNEQVILARALVLAGATRPSTDPASVSPQRAVKQAGRKKREVPSGTLTGSSG